MKRTLIVSALLTVVMSGALWAQGSPPAGSPVAKHGQLKVVGNKILDKNNSPVVLRGMSLYWSMGRDARKFYNASAVQNLYSGWKATVIRAAMGVDANWAGDEQGYISDKTNQTRVETVVDAAIATGIYAIIDWHSHAAETQQSTAISFFEAMARKYKDVPNVIYEIYNEPVDQTWAGQIKPYAQAVVNAIRAIDPNNLILIGTRQYCQYPNEAADSPVNGNHLAYVVHFYSAQEGHKQDLRDRSGGAASKVPLFITEFGITEADGGGKIDKAEAEKWFDWCDKNHVGWANWSLSRQGETSGALTSGASDTGPWGDGDCKESGKFIRDKLIYYGTPITVTFDKEGEGTVAASSPSPYYPGETVTITATAGTAQRFEGWLGGDVSGSTTTPLTLVLSPTTGKITGVFFKENLLRNSTFTQGATGWNFGQGVGVTGSGAVDNGAYKVSITAAGTNNRNGRLQQSGVPLTQGRKYKLSFRGRAASSRSITPVVCSNASGAVLAGDTTPVQLTSSWQTFEKTYDMTAASVTAGAVEFRGGAATGEFFIDDVSLEDVGGNTGTAQYAIMTSAPFRAVQAGRALTLRGGANSRAQVTVYDMAGRVRMSKTVTLSGGAASVSLDRLPAGVYSARYKVNGETIKTGERIMLAN
jgi:endoglucanase